MYEHREITPAFGLEPTSVYSSEGKCQDTGYEVAIVNLPKFRLCAVVLDGNTIVEKLGRVCRYEKSAIRHAHDKIINSWVRDEDGNYE